MKGVLHILLLPILFLLPYEQSAQSFSVEEKVFNEENGLSPYANFTLKDSRGIIWVGTQFGLFRFEGDDFVSFNEDNGLPFREVMEIFEDEEGWFWLVKTCRGKPICEKNLAFFHPLSYEVLSFEERFGNTVKLDVSQVVSVCQSQGKIYLTTSDRLIWWNKKEGIQEINFEPFPVDPILFCKIQEDLFGLAYGDNEGYFYASIDLEGNISNQTEFSLYDFHYKGFFALSKKSIDFNKLHIGSKELNILKDGQIKIKPAPNIIVQPPTEINTYLANEDIYYLEGQGIMHEKAGRIENPLTAFPIWRFVEEDLRVKTGNPVVWINNTLDPPNQQDRFYIKNLGGFSGRHVFYDKENNTAWFAMPKGVERLQFKEQKFQKILHENVEVEHNSLLARSVSSGVGGKKYFANGHGFFFSEDNGLKNLKPIKVPKSYITVNPSHIYYYKDREEMWIGANGTLNRINEEGNIIEQLTFSVDSYEGRTRCIYAKNDVFWIGAADGLTIYDRKTNQKIDLSNYENSDTLINSKIHFFKESAFGQIWVGTNTGLYLFSLEQGLLGHFGNTNRGNNYLPAINFFHMEKARQGGYWLATMNGLLWWNPEKSNRKNEGVNSSLLNELNILPPAYRDQERQYIHYSDKLGLHNNELFAVYEDDYGFLWSPTPHGLIQVEIKSGRYKVYLEKDGLSHSSFQEYTHHKDDNGILYFGGYAGFNVFDPADFRNVDLNPEVPLIVLNYEQHKDASDKVENRTKELLEQKEIIIEPGEKLFNLTIALSDYRDAHKHRFAYKIKGYQEEWQEGRSNLIRVSGLPYGNYTLQVKGRLPDGQYAEPELSIPIKVLKPFYLQTWFVLLSILTLLITGLLWLKRRTQAFKQRQIELEQIVEERTAQIKEQAADIERQAEELRNMDKLKSRFFANVSHELRTPLTLMLGPLKTMIKSHKLDNKNFTLANLVQQNTQHLLKLVNEILDLTKLESAKLELKEENTALYNLMQRLISAFESHAQQQGIQFEFHFKADKYLQLKLDNQKFSKIINNLLSNAFKFTEKGGSIIVSVEDLASHMKIAVKDTGRGIHPEDVKHVFDRFYQSSQPNAPTEGGTGIGLALSKELTKLMEGRIWVESKLGEGSTFFVEIPKKEVMGVVEIDESFVSDELNVEMGFGAIATNGASEIATEFVTNGKPMVLVVEDNPNLRSYIELILKEYYQVVIAENGAVALEQLKECNDKFQRKPSLIVSDIMMPVMDGYQLLERLKNSSDFYSIPVVMLTALAELKDKLKALRIGVDDYLIKPFEEEELIARIQNLLQFQNSRQHKGDMVQSGESAVFEGELESDESAEAISKEDLVWLEELEGTILEKLGAFDFSVENLATEMAASRYTLYRKIKTLTGLTATQYLQEVRLNRARRLLEQKEISSIKSLAYTVGVKDVKYFSKQFKKRFGKSPSSYLS